MFVHMAMPATILQAMDEARTKWEKVPASLRALKRHFGTTDEEIGEAIGLSRQTAHSRLKGVTPLSYWELAGLAIFFGVPEPVLFAGPDPSVRWVLDHPDDERLLKSRNFLIGWSRSIHPVQSVPA